MVLKIVKLAYPTFDDTGAVIATIVQVSLITLVPLLPR